MTLFRARYLLILLLGTFATGNQGNMETEASVLIKSLRELANQTEADTLNLPANASSIRENITDTFSCENRTYGYYADVDNDCQVFHVCLPSQTPSGRNVTYRWSFICPNETIFNQEVLTCTRPADSIDCEDSPLYYHLNTEIGKVPNKTEEQKDKKDTKRTHKRRPENIRQNFVMENINTVMQEEMKDKIGQESPMLIEAVIDTVEPESESTELEDGADLDVDIEKKIEELDRIVMERSLRDARQMRRGAFRFKSDV